MALPNFAEMIKKGTYILNQGSIVLCQVIHDPSHAKKCQVAWFKFLVKSHFQNGALIHTVLSMSLYHLMILLAIQHSSWEACQWQEYWIKPPEVRHCGEAYIWGLTSLLVVINCWNWQLSLLLFFCNPHRLLLPTYEFWCIGTLVNLYWIPYEEL